MTYTLLYIQNLVVCIAILLIYRENANSLRRVSSADAIRRLEKHGVTDGHTVSIVASQWGDCSGWRGPKWYVDGGAFRC